MRCGGEGADRQIGAMHGHGGVQALRGGLPARGEPCRRRVGAGQPRVHRARRGGRAQGAGGARVRVRGLVFRSRRAGVLRVRVHMPSDAQPCARSAFRGAFVRGFGGAGGGRCRRELGRGPVGRLGRGCWNGGRRLFGEPFRTCAFGLHIRILGRRQGQRGEPRCGLPLRALQRYEAVRRVRRQAVHSERFRR